MARGDDPSASVVRAESLGCRYGARAVLHDLSFELGPGVTGLVGVNGAGKSTLMRLLGTRLTPSTGSLTHFGGDPVADRTHARRQIGYMPQSLELPSSLTVQDFLAYAAWLRRVPRRTRPAVIEDALRSTDLLDRARSRVGALSGGMHRRLLLAQALLSSPPLLLLDEPTAGLDPEQRIRLRRMVTQEGAERTTVVSSHVMADLVGLADRVLMLDEGRMVFDGTVEQLGELGSGLVTPESDLSPYEAAFLSLCSRGDR